MTEREYTASTVNWLIQLPALYVVCRVYALVAGIVPNANKPSVVNDLESMFTMTRKDW